MAQARQRVAWDHTASLMALIANAHRGKKGRAFQPADFHPMRQKQAGGIPIESKEDFQLLRMAFTNG